jgi:predicted metal-dependent enzyme (double-stranded beta helix superfamily)
MFKLESFIEECRAAIRHDPTYKAVQEVVARAVSSPSEVIAALGEPGRSEMQKLYESPELTILNVIWAPRMILLPHNHNMWAVIGIYTGREDNVFWRRVTDGIRSKIEAAGAKSLSEKDAVPLGADIIHSVTNPIGRLTGALHVYGGDFFAPGRSEWDSETLLEQPCDPELMRQRFEEANSRTGIR